MLFDDLKWDFKAHDIEHIEVNKALAVIQSPYQNSLVFTDSIAEILTSALRTSVIQVKIWFAQVGLQNPRR